MAIHNNDIADAFDEIADILEIQEENPFRIRAYRNAARTLRGLGREVSMLLEKGEDLTKLPGIGKDLASKIRELIDSGHCDALEKLRKQVSPGLTDLLKIPGMGPKHVRTLYQELDIHTPEQLYRAARDKRIRTLPGFGEKTELHILEAIEQHAQKDQRIALAQATQYAEALAKYLQKIKGVRQVIIAGSYRRAKETVGDLDILTTVASGSPVMQHFTSYEEVKDIVSQGDTRATVILHSGLQVDLRAVPVQSLGAALHYFTGSKAHNIAIRRMGQQKGLKINEYGVFKGDKLMAGDTEESVFHAVGLDYIPPELRENRGEIEAAGAGLLPSLIEISDIKGDLHAHTKASDGHDGLKQMALAAKKSGLSYLAITEHSKHLTVAHGLDQGRLLKQIEEIDRLNETLGGIVLLKGIEVDILEDGRLDLPDALLAKLDLVIGAVHSQFHLSRARQTQRILKAMDHPHFTLLAHPSGRLLQQREPYDVDIIRVIRHARQRGCYLELNAQPERLDLIDTHCRLAKDEGVMISINSDAHSALDFDNLRYGIGQARRGWLTKEDVINTRSLREVRKLLRQTM